MDLLRKNYLKELREKLVKEFGGNIPDEDWNKIIEKIDNDLKKDLQQSLPKAFWFSLFEIAEKEDVIFEIDGIDIGAKIRKMRSASEFNGNKD